MGGSAPSQDPNMGIAAIRSAQTGQEMLNWMQSQAKITNGWAAEDRKRDIEVFRPLQNRFINEAQNWDTQGRQNQRAAAASADVNIAARQQQDGQARQAMAMGVNPASGRYASATASAATDTALAAAGAGNLARREVRAEADAKQAQAINLGMGLAVNPGTSIGISNGASQAGFSGAMQGYEQQANILSQDYENRMTAWQASQNGMSGLLGGLGTLAGAFLPSSKTIKHDMKPAKGSLEAARKMPVGDWTYDEGKGDGGRHIGPYAEEFTAATGLGDGKSIDAISLMGVTLGAVQELDAKVTQLSKQMGSPKAKAKHAPQPMGLAA